MCKYKLVFVYRQQFCRLFISFIVFYFICVLVFLLSENFIHQKRKDVCCVCKTSTSRHFSPSKAYESEFQSCFKICDSNLQGKLCDTYKGCVYSFRQSMDTEKKDFSWQVACCVGKVEVAKHRRKLNFLNSSKQTCPTAQVQSRLSVFEFCRLPVQVIVNILSYLPLPDLTKALPVLQRLITS